MYKERAGFLKYRKERSCALHHDTRHDFSRVMHDLTRGSGKDFFQTSRVESGRVKRFSNLPARSDQTPWSKALFLFVSVGRNDSW